MNPLQDKLGRRKWAERPLSPWLVALLSIGLIVAVFWPLWHGEFLIVDDLGNLVESPRMGPPLLANLLGFWSEPYRKLFVPVPYTVWALVSAGLRFCDVPLRESGASASAFHLLNLLVHCLNVGLVYGLALEVSKRVNGARRPLAALGGALLFALHPIQVEPVAWIICLRDLLATTFALLSILAYLRFRSASSSRAYYALALAACVLALLSKPSMVVLPCFVLILMVALEQPTTKSTVLPLIPWFLLALPVAWITSRLQAEAAVPHGLSLADRGLVSLDSIAFSIRHLLVPWSVLPDYGRRPELVVSSLGKTLATVALTLGLVAFFVTRGNRRLRVALVSLWVVSLLPTSGLVSFEFQEFTTVTDRYSYLGMVAAALGLALLLQRAGKRAAIAALVALVGYSIRTSRVVPYWVSTPSIYEYALEGNPKSVLAHMALANWYGMHGDSRNALPHWTGALVNGARRIDTLADVVQAELEAGNDALALEAAQRTVRGYPASIEAREQLAAVRFATKDLEGAEAEARGILRDSPSSRQAAEVLSRVRSARATGSTSAPR